MVDAILVFTCVSLISIVSYCPSITGGFVFDDNEAILTNRDLDPDLTPRWTDVFTHDFWGDSITSNSSHKSYRPLTILSFRFDYIIGGGLNPLVFHVTNIVLHSMVSILFCVVVNELQYTLNLTPSTGNGNKWLFPMLSGLLFASHPIHTECVAGIVGRAELWSALVYLLSFLLYLKSHHHSSSSLPVSILCSWLLVIAGGVATLFKEQGITVLGVCSMYEFVKYSNTYNKKSVMLRLILMIIGGVGILYLRLWVMGFQSPTFAQMDNPAAFDNNTFTKLMTFNYLYSLNSWLLLNPYWLCFDWSIGCIPLISMVTDPRLIAVVVFWGIICLFFGVTVFNINKSRKFLIMSGSLIILPFLPSSNILFNVGFVIAERVLYLPSIGYCVLVGYGMYRLYRTYRKFTIGMMSFLIIMFVVQSFDRSIDWTSEDTLFTSGLQVCYSNAKVHYNVGKVSADKGDNVKAEYHYREAVRLFPEYDQALNNLGNLLRDSNRPVEGESLLVKAVTVNPTFAAAWMNLGTVKMELKKYSEAEYCYVKAISLRNKYADAYYNLGLMYIETSQFTKAIDAMKTAINYRENHIEAWNNLGLLYRNMNELDSAETMLKLAISKFPEVAGFHSTLGVVLGKKGQYKEGSDELSTAVKLDPYNAKYHGNLGVIYHMAKDYKSAKEQYEIALELDPTLSETMQNLVKVKNKLNT